MTDNFNTKLPVQAVWKNDVTWNLSGLFVHDEIIKSFMQVIKSFGFKNPISSIHGAPFVKWNSGRVPNKIEKHKIDSVIEHYAKENIPIYFTFSNPLIKTEDLDDKQSNYLLDKISEITGCGVIVSSDVLSKYIRDRYPQLKQTASILRSAFYEGERNPNYYYQLAEQFDLVVLHPDDALDYPLLQQLENKTKFEIMVNEMCLFHCKMRCTHYRYISDMCINGYSVIPDNLREMYCRNLRDRMMYVHIGEWNQTRSRSTKLTEDEVNYLYRQGFHHFKLQGRDLNRKMFLHYLTRYTLEPNIIAPLVYKTIFKT